VITQPANVTVTCYDLPGSPVENLSWAEINVVRTVRCNWTERHTLAKQLLGYQDGGIMYLPAFYTPRSASETINNCHCHKVDIAMVGDDRPGIDATTGDSPYAKLTIYYSTTEYDTTTLVTETLEPTVSFNTISTQGLTWQGDGAVLGEAEAPSQLLCLTDWVYTIHQLTSVPSAYHALAGYVNATAVYSRALDKWFEAETLLCNAPVVEREFTNWGVSAHKATFRFTYMFNGVSYDGSPAGWNHFPRHSASGGLISWQRICDSLAAWRYFYPLGDFWQIIR